MDGMGNIVYMADEVDGAEGADEDNNIIQLLS